MNEELDDKWADEEKYTPTTRAVRAMYITGVAGNRIDVTTEELWEEFDRWHIQTRLQAVVGVLDQIERDVKIGMSVNADYLAARIAYFNRQLHKEAENA
ncbi:MAG TPA: hypothetical protein VHK27_13725 [Gammaproteobacteria bacterium]|nr:hypothetical protein [Gammaproteobacteria bacterium]